jgi:hypothetical protein
MRGGYLTAECTKSRDSPARCATFVEAYTANYQGYKYYPREAASQPAKFTSSAPTTNSTVTPEVSYASPLKKLPHQDLLNITLGSNAPGHASTARAEQLQPTLRQMLAILTTN